VNITEPLLRAREATIRVILGDGTLWTWTLPGPLDGVHAHSDRNQFALPDLLVGPLDDLEIPRHYPLQIGFAFALPIHQGVAASLRIRAAGMTAYEGWAIVELMGHRMLAGRVAEVEQYGVKQLQLNIYDKTGEQPEVTQFYGGAAVYCVTPTTEITSAGARARESSPTRRSCPQCCGSWTVPCRSGQALVMTAMTSRRYDRLAVRSPGGVRRPARRRVRPAR